MKIDKTIVQNKIDVDRVFNEVEQEIRTLTSRKEEAENNISNLQTSVEEAESAKKRILSDFACGRASQEDLDEAAYRLNDLQQKLSLEKEKLGALQQREREIRREFRDAERASARAEEKVWGEISNNLLAAIDEDVKANIAKAYVASRWAERPLSHTAFLESLFPNPISGFSDKPTNPDEVGNIRGDLNKIFDKIVRR